MPPVTLTAYAKQRGVSVKAVSKAIAAGRLSASVVRDELGSPKISDPELADREWTANTRPRVDRPPPPPGAPRSPAVAHGQRAARLPAPAPASPATSPGPSPPPQRADVPDYNESRARREAAAARREAALADVAELDAAERKGELVAVAEARADVIDRFSIVRTKLLGIPSRIAQRMPHVAAEVVPMLEGLLREALEELALDDPGDEG